MEIYHLKARWLGYVFLAPAVWFILSLTGYTSFEIKGDEKVVAYFVITICIIVAFQCFLGSTRFYFDNSSQNGIQIRKHFYGKKTIYFPYSNIVAIAVRSYRRGSNDSLVFRVGLIEKTMQFGQTVEKFTTLRSYSSKEKSLSSAREFGKEICSYTNLNFLDNSEVIRPDTGIPGASFRI